MRSLILKLCILFFPFAVGIGLAFYVLQRSGELVPVDQVVQVQQNQTQLVLFGLAYSEPTMHFKLQSTLACRPDVLALGTSRVMQIRAGFFSDEVAFYNAGGGVDRIEDFRHFLEQIPVGQEPTVLIIALDQNLFNENWDGIVGEGVEGQLLNDRSPVGVVQASWTQVLYGYYLGKYTLKDLTFSDDSEVRFGLNAVVNQNGFRNDGSYYYGDYILDPTDPTNPDYQFSNTLRRIAEGTSRFQYGQEPFSGAIAELAAFLDLSRARNIYVVGFLPPYAHLIYEKMTSMPDQYAYLQKLEPTLRPMFEQRGFGFYDFSDLAWTGASDAETIDGFHASEKAYLRLFIQMVESDQRLSEVSAEISYLNSRLEASESDYLVFANDEN
jgi:hypothetical protein